MTDKTFYRLNETRKYPCILRYVVVKKDEPYYFDRLGDDFENFMDNYDVSQRCRLIFDDLLSGVDWQGKTVLEVGCGTGRISREIAARKAELTVLDIGKHLVEQVVAALGCKGVVGDACRLPFPDNSFDRIISSECIEHTLDPKAAVREMCRVCRPGGIICLTSPNKLWYPVLWLSVKTGIRKFRGIENWLFPGRAGDVMKQCGIGRMRISGCHLWPFQLTFTRPALRYIDAHCAHYLYPAMINYGISGVKKES